MGYISINLFITLEQLEQGSLSVNSFIVPDAFVLLPNRLATSFSILYSESQILRYASGPSIVTLSGLTFKASKTGLSGSRDMSGTLLGNSPVKELLFIELCAKNSFLLNPVMFVSAYPKLPDPLYALVSKLFLISFTLLNIFESTIGSITLEINFGIASAAPLGQSLSYYLLVVESPVFNIYHYFIMLFALLPYLVKCIQFYSSSSHR